MDEKTLYTLEFPKILERLASYCAFPASIEKAYQLRPTSDIEMARSLQMETKEASRLLVTHSGLSIGGARDVRGPVDLARHGGILDPYDLLDIKYTMISARNLSRMFERLGGDYPNLIDIVKQLPSAPGLIDTITRTISDRGEILDSASASLGQIRHDLRIAHDRLLSRLQGMVSDPKLTPYLQEALVTQRDGRYVIPLRTEFKGRVKAIVHDQSASGATLFIEPLVVVELNNKYRELQLAERDEERRILAELSRQVAEFGIEIEQTVDVLARLDLALARARYAAELGAVEPVLKPILPTQLPSNNKSVGISHPGTVIRLYDARHPLLDPNTVVPIDVELDLQTYAIIVTGPNTGGKTVTLKTVGLLALMAQSGLHIPAGSGSEISVFHQIFADIGDEQSIEQSLSTFSGHITNIIHILTEAEPSSLVILDELGAGTDPQEGAALARAILTHLLERGVTTLVTTHHPELKAYAHATRGAINASVEFDMETLRPTYRLTIGLPGRSNALAIAQRLGLPDSIITAARAELSPDEIRAEDLLNEIHYQRELSLQARTAAENARQDAEKLRAVLAERLDKLENERLEVLDQARREAQAEVEAIQGEIIQIRRQLTRARQPLEALQEIEEKVEEISNEVMQPIERAAPDVVVPPRRAIQLGDKVRLRSLGTQGVISALGEEEAEIQVGMLRIRARLAELELVGLEDIGVVPVETGRGSGARKRKTSQVEQASTISGQRSTPLYAASPGIELDLRGRRADESIDVLDRYLDAAFLAGLPFVRIIHGKGTGRLREVVRQMLAEHPQIKSYEAGSDKEGGEGVTVAKLKTS